MLCEAAASLVKRASPAVWPHVRPLREALLPLVCDALQRDKLLRLRPEVSQRGCRKEKGGRKMRALLMTKALKMKRLHCRGAGAASEEFGLFTSPINRR